MAEKNPETKYGRPRKAESMRRTKIVQAKLTAMEYENVKKGAEKAGMSVYAYIKEAVISERKRPSQRLTVEIWGLAKNLIELANNIVRIATILADKYPEEDMKKYIEEVQKNKDLLKKKLKI